jgi:rhodanese-related sulfurtransferase
MMPVVPEVDVRDLPDPLPEGLTLLDVREPDEWDEGHIEGALHIPMMSIPGEMGTIPADGQVLVVCHVGARSARVAAFLQQQGVDAYNLAGGMVAWARAGRPISATGSGDSDNQQENAR